MDTFEKRRKGFTLIELLVVVAIIGLLATAIIVFLTGTVRGRARDARIASALSQIRNAAAVYQDKNESYNNVCTDPDIASLINDINSNLAPPGQTVTCGSSSSKYCARVKLNTPNKWWCVDSTLQSQEYTSDPTNCGISYECGGAIGEEGGGK